MNKRKIIIVILIFFVLISSSCVKKTPEKPMNFEKKEKAPKNLVQIYDKISKTLENTEKINQTLYEYKEIRIKLEQKNIDEDKKRKDEKDVEEKEKEIKKMFDVIDKDVEEIHKLWSSYQPQAFERGIDNNDILEFQNILNNFTVDVENRDSVNILNNGSQLFLSMSPFFNLYKDDIRGDICRIKYLIYQAYLTKKMDDNQKALDYLDECNTYLDVIRREIGEDKKKLETLEKVSFSIKDMKLSLKQQSNILPKIKRDLIIDSLDELEK